MYNTLKHPKKLFRLVSNKQIGGINMEISLHSQKRDILDSSIDGFKQFSISREEFIEYKKLSTKGFILTDKWVLKLKKEKQDDSYSIQVISTHVKITSCNQNLKTSERTYNIEIYNGKEYVSVILDSTILTSQGCKVLLKYGCIFNESDNKLLLEYLSNSAFSAPIKIVHDTLGWDWKIEPPNFLTSKMISSSGNESDYIGDLDLRPKGSLSTWLEMIESEVKNNVYLLICLLIGFSSMILGYLNHYTDLGCLVFNFCNNSSKGKTTAAMLIASIFGNPELEKGTIVSMNSTKNAIIGFASKSNCHTICFDEAGTGDKSFFRETLYQLATGSDKKRENPDGSLKEQKTFNSCIVCTSEFPILDNNAPNGLRTRIFELNYPLTTSAENSDNIKKCLFQNYGYAGIEFAKFVIDKKIDNILTDYKHCIELLKNKHNKLNLYTGELTDRILSKLAVIALTSFYAQECFNWDYDVETLINQILSIEQSVSSESDVSDKALECVLQYVTRNNNRFYYEKKNDPTHSYNGESIYGVISTLNSKPSHMKLTILRSIVEEILAKNGFENSKTIYDGWKKNGHLIAGKDRPYKRLKLQKQLPVQQCFEMNIEII